MLRKDAVVGEKDSSKSRADGAVVPSPHRTPDTNNSCAFYFVRPPPTTLCPTGRGPPSTKMSTISTVRPASPRHRAPPVLTIFRPLAQTSSTNSPRTRSLLRLQRALRLLQPLPLVRVLPAHRHKRRRPVMQKTMISRVSWRRAWKHS